MIYFILKWIFYFFLLKSKSGTVDHQRGHWMCQQGWSVVQLQVRHICLDDLCVQSAVHRYAT